ncbi:MAG: 2-dehydropantoate 2-reductase, partial [bacterium]
MTESKKNVLIFGSGSVGCLIGGLLTKAGHRVTFVGRERIVRALRDCGLSISGVWGDHEIAGPLDAYESVSDIPEESGPWHWALITTKSFDTANAVQELKPLFPRIEFFIS